MWCSSNVHLYLDNYVFLLPCRSTFLSDIFWALATIYLICAFRRIFLCFTFKTRCRSSRLILPPTSFPVSIMAGPANSVWVNLSNVFFFVHEIQIVKANYLLAWYSTWCYSASTLHRHISIISIQKSAYPCRYIMTTLHIWCPFCIFISEIHCGSKFRLANAILNLSFVRTLNLPVPSVNRSLLSLSQTSFNRHSYLYIFIGL